MRKKWRMSRDADMILTLKLDTDAMRHALDTARPDRLVELRVDAHVTDYG